MSSIVLSAATRSSLLAAQSTADMMATTQNRLSTGKKVNTALDNPTSFFTASGLDSRAGDLSDLLDSIGNGVQTIQAASQGITSIQKLVDQAKSLANQALQSSSAFSAKGSQSSTAFASASATNLLSTGATVKSSTAIGTPGGTAVAATAASSLTLDAAGITSGFSAAKSFSIDGVDITTTAGTTTQSSLIDQINTQLSANGSGVRASFTTNTLTLTGTADGANVTLGGTNIAALMGTTTASSGGTLVASGGTKAIGVGFTAGQNFLVNGATVSVTKDDTLSSLATKIGTATNGAVAGSFDAGTGKLTLKAQDDKTSVSVANGTGNVSNLGLTVGTTGAGLGSAGALNALNNKSLTVQVGSGSAVTVNFGSGAGQISSLDDLNAALTGAGAVASLTSDGKLNITTSNDAGAETLKLSGTATGGSNPFVGGTIAPSLGGDGETARNNLVKSFNDLLSQIDQLSKDASFNGVNLLNGDNLKLTFNEKNTSNLSIQGIDATSKGLGLDTIQKSDFSDAVSINSVMSKISGATNGLRSSAATLGSNLTVVQNRQDFSKNLINVLQTGSANLVNADLNEEAANSQALSTRSSLAISALSLANTAQQGVLQLLR